jgi:hypothetical protein
MGKKAIAFGIAKGTGAILKKKVGEETTIVLLDTTINKEGIVKGGAAAASKGIMNTIDFAANTVPDTWGAAKRFIQVMQM